MLNDFYERLQVFINKAYGSQRRFANAIKKPTSDVTRWKTNKMAFGIDALHAMVQAGVSADWLFTGQGEMYAQNDIGEKLAEQEQIRENQVQEQMQDTPIYNINEIAEEAYEEILEEFKDKFIKSFEKKYMGQVRAGMPDQLKKKKDEK